MPSLSAHISEHAKESSTLRDFSDNPENPLELSQFHVSPPSLAFEEHRLLGDDEETIEIVHLPPVDRGAAAWKFLAGLWLIEAMLWGFPLAFGLFQSHYSADLVITASGNSQLIPTIGTTATGLSYLLCPISSAFALQHPNHLRLMLIVGYSLCLLSLLLASFSNSVWHLLITQGILYGVGWVTCYTPFLIMLNEWFDKRRGLAYGILFGASGVSGLILPFLLEKLLSLCGFRNTLRIYVLATMVISVPAITFVKHRLPQSHRARSIRMQQKALPTKSGVYVYDPVFYLFLMATFLQGIAFFIPNIFLPTYSSLLSLPPLAGDAILSITACAQVTGQILLGHFSDRVTIHLPSHMSALISGLAVFFIWGPTTGLSQSRSLVSLLGFSTVWGAFAGSYSVLWTRVASVLAKNDDADTMRIYGWLSAIRGVANVLAGPVSGLLVVGDAEIGQWGLGVFKHLVMFTGICLCASAIVGFTGWLWRPGRTGEKTPT